VHAWSTTPTGMHSGSCELFKFCERSGSISEMVQGSHIVAIED